jgi:hypothetical protein
MALDEDPNSSEKDKKWKHHRLLLKVKVMDPFNDLGNHLEAGSRNAKGNLVEGKIARQ